MNSKRSSRFPRRSLSRRLAAAGAAWLVAGPVLAAASPPAYATPERAPGSLPAGTFRATASLPATTGPSAATAYTLEWTDAHPPVSPPTLRNAAAAYDGDTSTVVVFGGVTAGGSLSNDTWVWDGQSWSEHTASSMTQAPPARQDASMAFDPSLHQLILFGGQGAGGTLLGDTWAWNGASWYQLPPGPYGGPGARRDAALALSPNGDLVLFGGLGPPATEAPTTTTTTAPSAQPTPPASTTQAVAPAAERVLGDTWEWTSRGWAPTSAAGPTPRWGAAVAYDSTDHTTVLFSGDTADPGAPARLASGTWTWDGTRWARQTPKSSPPARFQAVMADDPVAGGTVLVTGDSGSAVLADGWIWDGSTWVQAGGQGSVGRSGAAGAYDSSRSTLVVFAGAGAGGASLDDTELVTTVKAQSSPTTTPASTTTTRASGPTTGTSSPTTRPAETSTTTAGRPPTSSPSTAPGRQPSSSPSSAAASPGPSSLALQTSLHNVRRGATVKLAGSGFAPGTTVTITFHSTPALVGRSVAGPSGAFSATVSVPRSATPGEHHFVATGVSPQGRPTTLLASVFVLAPPASKGVSLAVKLAMVGLALLIPAAAWLAMTGVNRVRRRRRRSPL